MSTSSSLHVVLGANGGIGQAVVRELVAQGKRVRAVNRRGDIPGLPSQVEVTAGDLMQLESTRNACQGADVIYHCAGIPYDRWVKDLPIMMDSVLAAAHETGAVLVYADNCYMYAPTSQPLTETMPYAPVTRKGKVRKLLAERLLTAHAQGKVRANIGRATGFYGPGVLISTMGEQFFPNLIAGKGGQWLGSSDLPHAMTFVDDVARAMVTLGEEEQALGQVWHIPAAEPLTGREYITLASQLTSVIHQGSIYDVGEAMVALFTWMAANDYQSAGAYREIHLFGHEADEQVDLHNIVIEMQIPVQAREKHTQPI